MLAAMLSHGRQRFGARGGAREVMLYQGLPRMDKYATQSGHFHKNPNAHIWWDHWEFGTGWIS
jgi:hypothetical protein